MFAPRPSYLVLPGIRLRPIDTPEGVRFVDGILERAGDLFDFPGGFHHAAQNDDESNWLAYDAETFYPVGFGRLKILPWAPVLVASYGIHEDHRRQRYGTAILLELHAKARGRGLPMIAVPLARNVASMRLLLRYFGPPLFAYDERDGDRAFLFGDESVIPFFQ